MLLLAKLARLMSSDLSISIDPEKLAIAGEKLSGAFMLKDMDRLAELISKKAGNARFNLVFSRNDDGIFTITGEIWSELTVMCQRCLNDMTLPIHIFVSIGVVKDDDELEASNEELDPFQTEDGKISVLKLIEDEILLGLPLSPMHNKVDCPATESLQEYTAVKQNPFAVLETLKREKT